METNDRKEIVQVNGLTILTVAALVANFLIVGFMYRWHSHELFRQEKLHNVEYTELLGVEHDIKLEIVALEGVPSWSDTAYVRALGKRIDLPQ